MSRSSVKTDVPPHMLPGRMRDDYLRMTSGDASSPVAHLEASLRPGCTHIVATSLAEVLSPSPQLSFYACVAIDTLLLQHGTSAFNLMSTCHESP